MGCNRLHDEHFQHIWYLFPTALLVNGVCAMVSAGQKMIFLHSGHRLVTALQGFAKLCKSPCRSIRPF